MAKGRGDGVPSPGKSSPSPSLVTVHSMYSTNSQYRVCIPQTIISATTACEAAIGGLERERRW
nr:hypothetical protein Iba_chr10cCG12400 [Ipomoea batatas]